MSAAEADEVRAVAVGYLRRIAAACARPFGKDARTARRLAIEALERLDAKGGTAR